jgi:hypothetical protein
MTFGTYKLVDWKRRMDPSPASPGDAQDNHSDHDSAEVRGAGDGGRDERENSWLRFGIRKSLLLVVGLGLAAGLLFEAGEYFKADVYIESWSISEIELLRNLLIGAVVSLSVLAVLLKRSALSKILVYYGYLGLASFALAFPYCALVAVTIPKQLGYSTANQFGLDFFTTSAQVLPVLLLGLIIDSRKVSAVRRSQQVTAILIAGIGEGSALIVLAFPRLANTAVDFATVAAAFFATLVAMTCAVLGDPELSHDE